MKIRNIAAVAAIVGCGIVYPDPLAAAPGNGGGGTTQPPVYTYKYISATVHEIPMQPDYWGEALDINNGGDIVGWMAPDGDPNGRRPFIHMDGQTWNLMAPGMGFSTGHFMPDARGINDSRRVVGYYMNNQQAYERRGFFYEPGIWLSTLINTPLYGPAGWNHVANAINDSGVIVGQGWTASGDALPQPNGKLCGKRPVIWNSIAHSPTALFCVADPDGTGTIDGYPPAAYDINNAGSVVGVDTGTTQWSMFLYKNGQVLPVPPPAGVPQTSNGNPLKGFAFGINEGGKVVGTFGTNYSASLLQPGARAFIWDGVSPESESLGVLTGGTYSIAREVNDQNMVAGLSERRWNTLGSQPKRELAFVWHKDFGMKQLPALHYEFFSAGFYMVSVGRECRANSIGNRGPGGIVRVVGMCVDEQGDLRAVRWDVVVEVESPFLGAPIAP